MYEKFIALALVLAATVEGQADCDPYYGDCEEVSAYPAAPTPMFDHDSGMGVYLDIPEEFATVMAKVHFGHMESDSQALDDWIAGFDWESVPFGMPNYQTFYGVIALYDEPLVDEGSGVCLYSPDWDDLTNWWCIRFSGLKDGELEDVGTRYFPKEEIHDAETFHFEKLDITEYRVEGFAKGAGVGGELGYEYQVHEEDYETLHEYFFWHYDHDENDGYNWRAGDYSVLVIHSFDDQTFAQFEQDITIANMSGATQLACASMAAATALYALL